MISAIPRGYMQAVRDALTLLVFLLSVAPLQAQSDRVESLGSKGELRAALILSDSGLVTRNPEGQLSGILVDISNALAANLGVTVSFISYDNLVHYNQSIGKDQWDIALVARDLSRIERLAFSETFLEVDDKYVVPGGSFLRSVDDVDRSGIRVAVAEHSPADGFLSRTLRKATIIRLPKGNDEAREALTFGRADVYANTAQDVYQVAKQLAGATVLVGRFSAVQLSFVVPKSKASEITVLNKFVREAKRDGMISNAIKHNNLQGVRPGR